MINIARNTLLSIAAFGFCAGISMSAAAAPVDETFVRGSLDSARTIRIQYNPGDLATEQGLEKLQSQIKRAAKKVCGPTSYHDAGGVREMSRNRECYDDAIAAAYSQLALDRVAAIGS